MLIPAVWTMYQLHMLIQVSRTIPASTRLLSLRLLWTHRPSQRRPLIHQVLRASEEDVVDLEEEDADVDLSKARSFSGPACKDTLYQKFTRIGVDSAVLMQSYYDWTKFMTHLPNLRI